MQSMAKKKISMRLDEELLELLEMVSTRSNSVYFDRDRTWLVEHALKQQYGPLAKEFEREETVAPASN